MNTYDLIKITQDNHKVPDQYPFEIHVSVRTDDIAFFKSSCFQIGVKPIVLDLQNQSGQNIFYDVMTSYKAIFSSEHEAFEKMKEQSLALKSCGFHVIREKIETVPWHPSAPSLEQQSLLMPQGCYFECHFNIKTRENKLKELMDLAKLSGCHLSKNIFKKLESGYVSIMMTKRSYHETMESFQKEVAVIEQKLLTSGYLVEKVIVEFCIYDSNVSHDDAWLKI